MDLCVRQCVTADYVKLCVVSLKPVIKGPQHKDQFLPVFSFVQYLGRHFLVQQHAAGNFFCGQSGNAFKYCRRPVFVCAVGRGAAFRQRFAGFSSIRCGKGTGALRYIGGYGGSSRIVNAANGTSAIAVIVYEESGGGVTLSGGEALMRPEFALVLIQALKARHISVAIETTGCAEREIFDRVTSEADLLLFDVKHWDEQKHREGTGVSSRMIMENLKHAITSGRNVLPGIPVIPGFNDSIEDARGFAAYLHAAGAEKVRLLPFHQFGEKKYDMLHQSCSYADVAPLHEEELEPFRLELVCLGIHAFFHNDSEA